MIGFPNCKINLGLRVKARRDDGFHEVETIMYPLQLKESLEIVPSEEDYIEFSSSGIPIPEDGKMNLCEEAFTLLHKKFKIPYVKIHLLKKIPIGAGLGGGSADAAFTLMLLKKLFKLPVSNEEMYRMSSKLGSDVSFFLMNQPVIATGKGDQLIDCGLSLKGKHLVLIVPPLHISTAEAYAGIKPSGREVAGAEELTLLPLEKWRDLMINDFEDHIFAKYPAIRTLKEKLYALGAEYASMSGSGSSVFGIFSDMPPENIGEYFPDSFTWQEKLTI
ncbi:MAG: 4-(cytidine 5'-diphospho)-2-C-methyl-D-erythritol kinase [Bacteroidales bacterium]